MRHRYILPALCVAAAAVAADAQDAATFAGLARYRGANEVMLADTARRCRVVLFGNSITEMWPERHPEFFKQNPQFAGRGISGQTSSQFLLRFRQDVIDLAPEVVVINFGTNDIAENTGVYDEDVTCGNIASMVEMARANGIAVVLCSTLPAEGFKWRPSVKDAMDKIRSLNRRMEGYARANGIPYVDYYTALVDRTGTRMDSAYAADNPGVHPNAAGYAEMEKILMPVLAKMLDK